MNVALLKQTDNIKKYKCSISISEIKEQHLNVCIIESFGKNKWNQPFYSIYGGYAMLLEKYLFDLPGRLFLAYQINEHSKGGHCEYETQIMNLQGKILNKFSGDYHSNFLLDGKYLWFLKSGKKRFELASDRDLDLVKLNINTGKVKQIIKLNYPRLLNCDYSFVIGIELVEKRNAGLLKIKYKDDLNYATVKHIPIDKV